MLFIIAGYLASQAVRRSFMDGLNLRRMNRRVTRWATVTGVVGTGGRAALFGIVGWFVAGAAIDNDPRQGRGVDGAVRQLAANPVGAGVLWVLAASLVSYAVYLGFESQYRKV